MTPSYSSYSTRAILAIHSILLYENTKCNN